ncbi:hypothetical protein D3C76_1697810 [compost metagenome]
MVILHNHVLFFERQGIPIEGIHMVLKDLLQTSAGDYGIHTPALHINVLAAASGAAPGPADHCQPWPSV